VDKLQQGTTWEHGWDSAVISRGAAKSLRSCRCKQAGTPVLLNTIRYAVNSTENFGSGTIAFQFAKVRNDEKGT
jgi:hypothetical protein